MIYGSISPNLSVLFSLIVVLVPMPGFPQSVAPGQQSEDGASLLLETAERCRKWLDLKAKGLDEATAHRLAVDVFIVMNQAHAPELLAGMENPGTLLDVYRRYLDLVEKEVAPTAESSGKILESCKLARGKIEAVEEAVGKLPPRPPPTPAPTAVPPSLSAPPPLVVSPHRLKPPPPRRPCSHPSSRCLIRKVSSPIR